MTKNPADCGSGARRENIRPLDAAQVSPQVDFLRRRFARAIERGDDKRGDHPQAARSAPERGAGEMSARTIPLASIQDGGAQMRVEMHPETVADYAADMLDGAVFPPIVLYH